MNDETRLEELLVEVGRRLVAAGVTSLDDLDGGRCVDLALRICPEDLQEVIQAGACRLGMCGSDPTRVGNMASHIDHTLLKTDATAAEIDVLCGEALDNNFASVCVNSSWVRRCSEILGRSPVIVCTVVGFPLGACSPETKAYEARRAIEDGACEVDMVLAVGALKSGDDGFVRRDISGVAETCHRLGARLKVILETCLLTPDEIVRASRLAREAGADFVKTSTGFSSGGATVEDVELMRQTVGPTMGVKASGGVRDRATAEAMIAAGATRIGASASVAIVRGGRASGTY